MRSNLTNPQCCRSESAQVEVVQWLESFAAAVRAADYGRGQELFADDVIAFGSRNDRIDGLDELVRRQWKRVWDCTRGFSFDIDGMRCDIDRDLASIATTWESEGQYGQGGWFKRTGRVSLTLQRRDGRWLAIHSHFSLTPKDSL